VVVIHHFQVVVIDKVFDSFKVIFRVTMGFLEYIRRIHDIQIGLHVFTEVVCGYGHVRHDIGDVPKVFQVCHLLSRNGSVRTIQFLESWDNACSRQVSPGTKNKTMIHLLLLPDIFWAMIFGYSKQRWVHYIFLIRVIKFNVKNHTIFFRLIFSPMGIFCI